MLLLALIATRMQSSLKTINYGVQLIHYYQIYFLSQSSYLYGQLYWKLSLTNLNVILNIFRYREIDIEQKRVGSFTNFIYNTWLRILSGPE